MSEFVSFLFFLFYFLFLQCSNRFSAPTHHPFSGLTAEPMVLGSPNWGQGGDLDDALVDLENQGHRSNVKVTRSKNVFSQHFAWANLDQCLSMQIEPYVQHAFRKNHTVLSIAMVHWPPMNKFAYKLHGYIVYFFLILTRPKLRLAPQGVLPRSCGQKRSLLLAVTVLHFSN